MQTMDNTNQQPIELQNIKLSSFSVELRNFILDLAKDYAASNPNRLASTMINLLKKIATYSNADLIQIVTFTADADLMKIEYEWNKRLNFLKKIKLSKNIIQSKRMPWLTRKILTNNILNITDTKTLPDSAIHEKKVWQKKGFRSLLFIPLHNEKKKTGFVNICSTNKLSWGNETVALLRVISGLANHALSRRSIILDLQHQTKMEALLTTIAQNLAATDYKHLDATLDKSLCEFGKYINADRAYIFSFSQDNKYMSNTHEWCNKNIISYKNELQNLERENFIWLNNILHENGSIIYNSVIDMPAEAHVFKDELIRENIKSIIILPILCRSKNIGTLGFDAVTTNRPWTKLEISLLKVMAEIIGQAIIRKNVEKEKDETQKKLRESLIQTIDAITGTSEKRDPYTSGHQKRVATLAVAIAKAMNLSPLEIEGIRLGSLIHDIGKISIPIELLNKPGKLSELEFNLIKTHSQSGYDIIKNIDFSLPVSIKNIVLNHHERIDGSGYPSGLTENELDIHTMIVSVADVVESMTSHRPYRPALGIDMALSEIEQYKGVLYNQKVADACLNLFKNNKFKF